MFKPLAGDKQNPFPITVPRAKKLPRAFLFFVAPGAWTVGLVQPVPLKTYRPQSAARSVRREGGGPKLGKRWEGLQRWTKSFKDTGVSIVMGCHRGPENHWMIDFMENPCG